MTFHQALLGLLALAAMVIGWDVEAIRSSLKGIQETLERIESDLASRD